MDGESMSKPAANISSPKDNGTAESLRGAREQFTRSVAGGLNEPRVEASAAQMV